MSYKNLKNSIKEHEGYRLEPYFCTENHLTGGYGHKILDGEAVPKTKEGWEELFDKDFDKALNGAKSLVSEEELDPTAFAVVVEMVYQMGTFGVSKFKNMIKALGHKNYKDAGWEMMDSKWARQTPRRAEELSLRMRTI